MKEYIERQAAIEAVLGLTIVDPAVAQYANAVYFILHNLPVADIAPVRHGRWMEYSGADKGFHYCSECKRQAFNYEENGNIIEALSKWCPNCGALMDGKEDRHEVD